MYPAHLLPRILDFLERNLDKRPFHKIVSHMFKLEDVNKAFPQAEWNARQTRGHAGGAGAVIPGLYRQGRRK